MVKSTLLSSGMFWRIHSELSLAMPSSGLSVDL